MVQSTFSEKISHLLSQYDALSSDEKDILQLISIIFEPTTSEIIRTCVEDIIRLHDQERLSEEPSSLFRTLRKLQERDLVNWRYQCNPHIVEIMSREALAHSNYAQMAHIVQTNLPDHGQAYDSLHNKSPRHVREMRIGLYLQDFNHFNEHLFKYYDCPETSENLSPLVEIINNPFDPHWFATLPVHLQLHGLHEICRKSHLNLETLDAPLAYLLDPKTMQLIPPEGRPSVYYLIILNLLLKGDIELARTKISEAGTAIDTFGLRGWLAFICGDTDTALKHFRDDLKELRTRQDKKNVFFIGPEGFIYILALLKTGDFKKFSQVSTFVTVVETEQINSPLLPAYKTLLKTTRAKMENFKPGYMLSLWSHGKKDAFTSLFMGLGSFWVNGKLDKNQVEELHTCYERALKTGYNWLAMEYAALLFQATGKDLYGEFSTSFSKNSGLVSLLSVLPHEQTWLRALKALNLVSREEEAGGTGQRRLVWLVGFTDGFVTVAPREQKLGSTGKWSQGRSIALKRFYSGKNLDFLSDHDRKIQTALHRTQSSQGISYEFDMDETLPALVGHPYLFLAESPTVPVEFIKGEPELRAVRENDKLRLSFYPPISDEKILAIRETATRFKVIEISGKHKKITSIIGDDGLLLPMTASKEVLQTLGNLSSCMTIHSDIGGSSTEIEEIPASSQITIQLLPVGAGFRVSMLIKPFGEGGPYLHPGRGSAIVIAEINGKRLQTRRDLEVESNNCAHIEGQCPTLDRLGSTSDGEWFIDDLQDCLEVLHEIENLGDEVRIEWPEGEKIAIRQHVSFQNFHLNIKERQNWFELDGTLNLDNDKVMEMKKLLDLTRTSSGRFIPLGRGQFLALSREFRKQLDQLNSFTAQDGEKTRLHPLASCILEGFTESGIQLTADKKWQNQLQRIRDSRKLDPELPATLQAELRDYQVEGFKWLARLCHWGVGACLADDMGLGKTLQALAIILQQAPAGPSLVVAPTSVCLNWQEEIRRFAPTLTAHLFGGKERVKLVEKLDSYDVLICSYGLLQQEDDILTSQKWQVIVLDEAQAIKNMSTKRSKAAMALEGAFKLITTGTPIENHLGELWNLFNFINPGLLGSLEEFNQRFAISIEKDKDKKSRQKLKQLIQPFILRRLKNQVLEELPPRTDVVLHVDMSQEEALFYEALRQQAVEKIEHAEMPPGQKHMKILAEIMKLRQACCNPRLVQPDSMIHSSKLELFGTIVNDLIENRHRALVFSQFTGHLQIIRSFLDKMQITYQYLDGSTPARKRQEQVAAFQAGVADLFLISLKAGGLGLNLTAADYVIHMDPWWNPAVEDQASDRAHRIGQVHPVTVYRLVSRNTIEEKILKLHHKKRKLADSLLEGSDMSHKISADELLQLLTRN